MQDGVHVAVSLSVLLVVEGLEFQTLLVNPRTALLYAHGVVQLGVEGQHVQVHLLAVHLFHGVHHVLYELGVGGTCRMHPDYHLGLLGLLLVSPLGAHLLTIGVDGVTPCLVGLYDGRCQQFEQTGCKAFTRGRVADDQG